MTNTLVVNCSLKTANDTLREAVSKFSEYSVVSFRDIDLNYQLGKNFDAVVISGSTARIVEPTDRALFNGVEHLIKNCAVPILGICYGHQLLCWTFGAKVGSLAQPVYKFEQVRVAEADGLFGDFPKEATLPLSESHNDYVLKESLADAGFVLLADSASCETEAVRHKTKPFYGTQFHPERITVNGETHSEGHKVMENFYRNCVKR